MKIIADRTIKARINARAKDNQAKRLFSQGISHEEISKEMGQTLEWVKLTLEDFCPKMHRREIEQIKAKQVKTLQENGKHRGRPPKEAKRGNILTVEDVLARYKRIRQDFKAGKWSSIREAAESEGLEVALVTRLVKGTSPIE